MKTHPVPALSKAVGWFSLWGLAIQVAGAEPLVHEAIIEAPCERVWSAWTTTEGLKSWLAPQAEIDLRVGGRMRSSYRTDSTLGDEHTIEQTILAFEPERMLAIRCTRAPADFPFQIAIQDTWSVIYFEPVARDRTRVRLVGLGYNDSEASVKMRSFFEAGNAAVLKGLQQKMAARPHGEASGPQAKPTPEDQTLQLVARLVGGEWIVEGGTGEQAFRVLNIAEFGPDGESVIIKGWLGGPNGMYYHSHSQIWRRPAVMGGGVWFHNLNEKGAVAEGEIRATADDTIEWDWNVTTIAGQRAPVKVRMVFSDADTYDMQLTFPQPNSEPREMQMRFQRVERAPDAFRQPPSAFDLTRRPAPAAGPGAAPAGSQRE